MLRRLRPCVPVASAAASAAASPIAVSVSAARLLTTAERDELSRVVSSVQSEAKGQHVDLSDMAEATRNALKQVQEAAKKTNFDDARLKAKVTTLQTALKAYSGRVANVQNEARSLQADAEKVIKMLYGTENEQAGDASSAAASSSTSAPAAGKTTEARASSSSVDPQAGMSGDFGFEAPPTAQRLQQMNQQAPGSPLNSNNTVAEEEIVVETIEEAGDSSSSSSSSSSAEQQHQPEQKSGSTADDVNQIKADETPISEITTTLHSQGIDFSDCREAKQLRQRYKDYLDGKFKKEAPKQTRNYQQPPAQQPSSSSSASSSSQYHQQQAYQAQQQQRQQSANTTETGLAADPNPNAQRKYLDTSRLVGDVKAEIARDNNVQPEQIVLWAGTTMLDDRKRLYEYPNLQSHTIEVRAKGQAPPGASSGSGSW